MRAVGGRFELWGIMSELNAHAIACVALRAAVAQCEAGMGSAAGRSVERQRRSGAGAASAAGVSKPAAPRPMRLVAGAGLVVKGDLGDAAFAQGAAGGATGGLGAVEGDAPPGGGAGGEDGGRGAPPAPVGLPVGAQPRGGGGP